MCGKAKISTANGLVLGVIQMMIGIFNVLMWYFILFLYMGQIKGTFGTYDPITYRTGCALWGFIYVLSGAFTISSSKQPTRCMFLCALTTNTLAIITVVAATALTVLELSTFNSLSYRNFGQAKLGREVSRVLLCSYPLEFAVALTYAINSCTQLGRRRRQNVSSFSTEAETSF